MAVLDPEIIQRVQIFWSEEMARSGGDLLSRRELYRRYCNKYGKDWRGKADIGLSKFNQIVRQSEIGGPSEPFPKSEWEPWRNEDETSELAAFLLSMDAVCHLLQRRRLYKHEADWAKKLRTAVQDLSPYDQFCFVALYAWEQQLAYFSRREISTKSLDAILVYKPWLAENLSAFRLMLLTNPEVLSPFSYGWNDPRFFRWNGLNIDAYLPWHLPLHDQPLTPQEDTQFQSEHAALQHWMGSNPIFPPPFGFEAYGVPDMTFPTFRSITYHYPDGSTDTREIGTQDKGEQP